MILYRTSSQKRRKSLGFLKNSSQQKAVVARLRKTELVNDVFSYRLPIPEIFASRLGPTGFTKIPFYSAKDRRTTFLEFGWNLFSKIEDKSLAVSAVCYDIKYVGSEPLDVGLLPNKKDILDPKDYSSAHAWVKSLNPFPESISYPSVRDPEGLGTNVAIYERKIIESTETEPEDFIITLVDSSEIEVTNLKDNSTERLRVLIR